MPERKIKLSWESFQELLKKAELLLPGEEIREITLVKPRGILIQLEWR